MPCPANIQDYDCAGNYGFDPLGFTNWVKVDWLREAELKHGRICQLAVVGFAATDLGFRVYPDPNGLHQVRALQGYRSFIEMNYPNSTSFEGCIQLSIPKHPLIPSIHLTFHHVLSNFSSLSL